MILTADIPKLRLFPPGWRHRPTPARRRSPGVFPKSRFSPPPGQPRTPAPRGPHRGSFHAPRPAGPQQPDDATSQDHRQNFVLRLKALPCQFLHPPVVETYACCRVSNIPGTFLHASSNTHGCQEFPCTYRGGSIHLVCCSHSCPIVLTQIFHFSIPACSIRPLQWNEFVVHAHPHIKQIGPCSRESGISGQSRVSACCRAPHTGANQRTLKIMSLISFGKKYAKRREQAGTSRRRQEIPAGTVHMRHPQCPAGSQPCVRPGKTHVPLLSAQNTYRCYVA